MGAGAMMFDKEQPAPEANGDSEPTLEVPDGFPEGRYETKAFSGSAGELRMGIDAQEPEPQPEETPQREETPSTDEQPDSD